MALTNRETIRDEIAALFTGITALQEVLAYPPLAFDGKSPVLYLHSDGTLAKMLAKHSNEFDHYFIATIAINRQAHGAAAAEDVLDGVYTAVLQAIRDTPTGTSYSVLVPATARSRPYFATVDGLPYRFEEVPIMARSNIAG